MKTKHNCNQYYISILCLKVVVRVHVGTFLNNLSNVKYEPILVGTLFLETSYLIPNF